MSSLQRRLSGGLAIGLVLMLSGLWWLVGRAIEDFGEGFIRSRLIHDAETLISALTVPPDGPVALNQGRMASIYRTPFSGHYYLVLTDDGQTLTSRSLWDQDLEATPLPAGEQRQWTAVGPLDQPLLLWSEGLRKHGRHFTIVVAEDLTQLSEDLVRFNWSFAGLALLILILSLVLQHYVVHRSLAPLERIRREVQRLQQGAVGGLDESVPDEVRPLVHEINRLLDLFSERLQRSRHALGNLAHALKHPLSRLNQIGRRALADADPALAEELLQQTDTIRQLMERELKRARLTGRGSPGSHFDPRKEMPVMVEMLQRMAAPDRAARGKPERLEIRWRSPAIVYPFDRDDMLELIGNLLDNACKWADSVVACEIRGDGRRLLLVVEDDGPGCSEEEGRRLTERGVRIDESAPGHGLGLAIVRDIVDIYKGRLEILRSTSLGGLRVVVELEEDSGNEGKGTRAGKDARSDRDDPTVPVGTPSRRSTSR